MIGSIKKFFEKAKEDDTQKTGGDGHDIRVATCAVLLEMANIDGEFSYDERALIVGVLERKFGLAGDLAHELIDATEKERDDSNDLWQFTNLINQNYSRDERKQIMKTVWEVIYTDGTLDKHEDYLARKLTTLLRLDHKDMIDAKLVARSGPATPGG